MIDVKNITSNLELSDSGIWVSRDRYNVSYPDGRHSMNYGIEEYSFWYHHRNRCLFEAMVRHRPNGPFFDIGGGNGIVSLAIKQLGIEVCLVEPKMDGALNAVRRGVDNVICSTLEGCRFGDEVLPAAGIFDVLEHIEDDLNFLEALKRVMVRKGKLFVTTPAFNFLWSRNDKHAGHFRRYTLKGLAGKLQKAGFIVEYATYFFALLPVPIFLFRNKLGICSGTNTEVKRREHGLGSDRIMKAVGWMFEKELAFIRKDRSMPFGSSCLVVASRL